MKLLVLSIGLTLLETRIALRSDGVASDDGDGDDFDDDVLFLQHLNMKIKLLMCNLKNVFLTFKFVLLFLLFCLYEQGDDDTTIVTQKSAIVSDNNDNDGNYINTKTKIY